MLNRQDPRLDIDCFLLAGKLLMQSGAETFRVEDTMQRMAFSQGYAEAVCHATITSLIFSAGHGFPTRIVPITTRTLDLHTISQINEISRKLTAHQLTAAEALETLKLIEASASPRPIRQIFFATVASGSFVPLFQGVPFDIPAAAAAGGLGCAVLLLLHRATKIKFFAEFFASLAVGCAAVLSVQLGAGLETDKIMISAVMPLVPGVAITNALRDLIAGHLVSGAAKGLEGLLTALSIGSGAAIALSLL